MVNEILIADFLDQARAEAATGALTDAGVKRDDVSFLSASPDSDCSLLSLVGDGTLAARLRLEGRDASTKECLQWIGLDPEEAQRLEDLMAHGGGLVVLSLPSEQVDAEKAQAIVRSHGASNCLRVRMLEPGKRDAIPSLRISGTVGDEPVLETFVVLKETVTVERRPTRRRATEADLEYFQNRVYDFDETLETLLVQKVAYVTEEIVVRTERTGVTQTVDERLRRLRLETEEL